MDNVVALIILAVELVLIVGTIVGMWKTFAKAGHPGWACLVPFYNIIVILQIAGKPVWWIVGLFIPLVNLVVHVIVNISFAEKFDNRVAMQRKRFGKRFGK